MKFRSGLIQKLNSSRRRTENARRRLLSGTVLFFSFLVILRGATPPCVWTGVEKIVAVGDIHGDYENLVKILRGTQLIDRDHRWAGGKTHLVQTGDILDRGPDGKKAFDLMMRLEKEAETAGGRIHFLLGNHEEMNLTGIAFEYQGYITVEQFVRFLPPKYREKREQGFRKKSRGNPVSAYDSDSEMPLPLQRFWEKVMKEEPEARLEYLKYLYEVYGKWLLSRNIVIKINDIIFVHGGISEEFSRWKLEDLNERFRLELEIVGRSVLSEIKPPTGFSLMVLYEADGPLWFRRLAQEDEAVFKPELDRILANLEASAIVIAHTPRVIHTLREMNRFGGKVWIIDTGIAQIYGGNPSALIIEKGKFKGWGVDNGQ